LIINIHAIIINFFTNGCCAIRKRERERVRKNEKEKEIYCERECTTGSLVVAR